MFNISGDAKLPLETTVQIDIGQRQFEEYLTLIADGLDGLKKWEAMVKKSIEGRGINCCTFINANPFTVGQRYLAVLASRRSRGLLVLVIQGRPDSGGKGNHESTGIELPFDMRLQMAKEGLSDLDNTVVLPSGPYIISRSDFPKGFLAKSLGPASAHAVLNSMVFCHVCRSLGIDMAIFGDEPRDELSEIHLNAMRQTCAENSISLKVAERKRIGEKYITSSLARQAIVDKNEDELRILVPKNVYLTLSGSSLKGLCSSQSH